MPEQLGNSEDALARRHAKTTGTAGGVECKKRCRLAFSQPLQRERRKLLRRAKKKSKNEQLELRYVSWPGVRLVQASLRQGEQVVGHLKQRVSGGFKT